LKLPWGYSRAIIGAMMFMIGIELTKFVKDVKPGKEMIPMIITVIIALITNMFFGFLAGVITHYLLLGIIKTKNE